MREDYKNWLEAQGYPENTCNSRISNVRTVERAYGEPIEAIAARGGLRDLFRELSYSKEDERRLRPNPSKVAINGNIRNGLSTLRNAVALYGRFLGSDTGFVPEMTDASSTPAAPDPEGDDPGQRLSLERDMQRALRRDLSVLEPGLEILDDGAERAVATGFIDILARDGSGTVVVIELKAGRTDARVIGQVLGYMSDIAEEEEARVRGIIVAHDFDPRTRSAARAVPNLALVRYAVSFVFAPVQ